MKKVNNPLSISLCDNGGETLEHLSILDFGQIICMDNLLIALQ